MDPSRLQASFGRVAAHGDDVPLYFYSHLFLAHPEVRKMFPVSMSAQRDRLVGALLRVVSHAHELDAVVPYLQQLGRDHRKYGVTEEHYPYVGESLLAALRHFLGEEWTPALEADWVEAYGLVAQVMSEAARESEACPAWFDAEVVDHERRTPTVAVLTVRPEQPVPYRAGQSVSVLAPGAQRRWRYLSPANAPRADGTIEFHVRAVDGGMVSTTLVSATGKGDVLRIGLPIGEGLQVDPRGPGDVLMIAGGTGLAPLRAIVEEMAERRTTRRVYLYVGARRAAELYDMPTLRRYESSLPWLRVFPVAHHDDPPGGFLGDPAEIATGQRYWTHADVCVCGSPEMVRSSVEVLLASGIMPSQIRRETYDYDRHINVNMPDLLDPVGEAR